MATYQEMLEQVYLIERWTKARIAQRLGIEEKQISKDLRNFGLLRTVEKRLRRQKNSIVMQIWRIRLTQGAEEKLRLIQLILDNKKGGE